MLTDIVIKVNWPSVFIVDPIWDTSEDDDKITN